MNKRFTKDLIIATAFNEWGKFSFKNMSLSLITDKLKITKPALYRYFKNKKELLNDMSNYLFNKLIQLASTYFDKIKNLKKEDKKDVILIFIREYFEFFGNNLYYFLFYIFYLIKDRYFENKNIIEINDKLTFIFSDFIKQNNLWIKPEQSENLLRYIFSTGIFLTIFTIHEDLKKKRILKKLDDDQINNIIRSIDKIITSGFKSNKKNFEIDFKQIEDLYFMNEISCTRNKIFESIANVVAKNGLWDASIKKIADDLNMSKSSLYLYFKNKKEMLSDMIIKEIEQGNERIQKNISVYYDFFEKLYCAVITISSIFVKDYRMMLVFDWFHYQGFELKVQSKIIKSDPFYILLQEAVEKKLIKINPFDIEFVTVYLKMQILKDILLLNLMKKEFNLNDMRFIFNMFLYGIYKE